MRLMLVGDTHEDIHQIDRTLARLEREGHPLPDAVLQVGDLGMYERGDWPRYRAGELRLRLPTYAIHGNHEDPELVAAAMAAPFGALVPNFRCLRSGELLRLGGVSILAVGGAHNPFPGSCHPHDSGVFIVAALAWRERGSPPVDLLLTHEAPSGVGLKGSPAFAHLGPPGDPLLRALWEEVRPRWQVNGHHHRLHRHEEGGLRHLTLPEAKTGVALLDTTTWEIEFLPDPGHRTSV